jgi:predicted secreted protein
MPAEAGRKLRIRYDDGGGMDVIAGARTDSFTIANEMIDITDKDDAGVRTLLDDIGSQMLSMSVEGVMKDVILMQLAINTGEDAALHDFEIDILGLGAVTAADGFFITNFAPSGVEGTDPATFTCGLESSGAISFTPV